MPAASPGGSLRHVRIDVITIFPQLVSEPLGASLLGKAIDAGVVDVRVHDLRAWTDDPHRSVDDAPFGGGPGMVMRPDVWFRAVESLDPDRGRVVLLSPAGRRLDQALVRELASEAHLTLLCGRYEGVDERVVLGLPAEEISIGDYVLSGGELPALVVIEAVTRLVPGVIGREASHEQDSFGEPDLLDHPQYTRPREFRGMSVPDVLVGGDHAEVERWRREAAIAKTRRNRPDLGRPGDD
jgi:tRNA (guanine37-N1)-methyltransferase